MNNIYFKKNAVEIPMHDPSRLAVWAFRRYFRFIFMGAVSTCLLFNLALHSASGLIIYCEEECLEKVLERPMHSLDMLGIQYIRDYYVEQPHPPGSFKNPQNVDNPPWGPLGKWSDASTFIKNYFKNYKQPGYFVEVGAQDGEFMSLSLWLEQKMNFDGLLIEPNPRDYSQLRGIGRSAYSINACANPEYGHSKDILWVRHVPSNIPPYLKRLQMGGNRLKKFVPAEDMDLGTQVNIQCFNLGAMIYAALGTTSIDFLSIATHGAELEILRSIPLGMRIRCLAITAPLAGEDDLHLLKTYTKRLGLINAHDSGNIRIFLPTAEVKIVSEISQKKP